MYKDKPSEQLKHRELNDRIFYEGVVKIYWGLKKPITVAPRRNYSARKSSLRDSRLNYVSIDDESFGSMLEEADRNQELTSDELKKFWEVSQANAGMDQQLTQSLNEAALASEGLLCGRVHGCGLCALTCGVFSQDSIHSRLNPLRSKWSLN